MLKDISEKDQRILAIAGAVGLLVLLIAWLGTGYGFVGAFFVGLIFAVLTALILWFVWRDADVAPQTTTAPAPAAPPEPAPTPVAAPESVAPTLAPTAAAAPVPAAAPMVKPSAPLAGEAELDAKKGDWKYEAPAKEAAPKKKAAAKPKAPKKPAAAPVAAGGIKPEMLTAARDGGPDNLKQIKGVGPKLEGILHAMGIFHFDQIAAWDADAQQWVDDTLEGVNKGRVTRDGWVEQAKTLAAGGTTAFSNKVKKGGVY